MTKEEVIAQYGMNSEGYPLMPSGAFDYSYLDQRIGGVEFTIMGMDDDGDFLYSKREPYYDALIEFRVDAEICIKITEPNTESEVFLDENTLFHLIGGA